MIYLIESAGFDETRKGFIKLLKIGYTEDLKLDRRIIQYKLHNPTCEILYTIPEATEDNEFELHNYFKDLRYSDYGREWYVWDQSIIDFFDSHRDLSSLSDVPELFSRYVRVSGSERIRLKNLLNQIVLYITDTIDTKIDPIDLYKKSKDDIIGSVRSDNEVWNYFDGLYPGLLNLDKVNSYIDSKKCSGSQDKIVEFLDSFKDLPGYPEKMKLLCESSLTEEERSYVLTQIPLTYKTQYIIIGPEKLRALGYNITKVTKYYHDLTKVDTKEIDRVVFDTFKVGSRYAKSDIKTTLAEIYRTNGLNRTAKASDLDYYFETKPYQIREKSTGKRINGFEILSIKEIEG